MKKRYAALCALLCAASCTVGAAASMGYQRIQAELRPDYRVVVDGVEQNFRTSSGERAVPIVYNDTTYLPLRAVGSLMGKDVAWNESTRTVTLTTPGTSTQPTQPVTSDARQFQQSSLTDLQSKVDSLSSQLRANPFDRTLQLQLKTYESDCDRLENANKADYGAGRISFEEYKRIDREIERVEDQLDSLDDIYDD